MEGVEKENINSENPEIIISENENKEIVVQVEQPEQPVNDIQPDTFSNGKHKKKCKCAECEAKRNNETTQKAEQTEEKVTTNSENPELDGWTEIKQEAGPASDGGPIPDERKKFEISGAMFIMGLEIIFPLALKYIVGFFEPKFKRLNKAGKKALELGDDVIEELMPYADELAKEIFGELPAWVGFGMLYAGAKFMLVEDLDDELHFNPPKEKKIVK